MITISVNIQGQEKLNRGFTEVEREISNLRPLWERFGEEVRGDEKALFARAPWPPLAPSTIRQKQARGFGDKGILRATDTLFRSLIEKGASGSVERIFDLSAEFGTSDEKAAFHQFGTSRMPARPPMIEPDVNKYTGLASDHFREIIEKAFM